MNEYDIILIINFGSQYFNLIVKRLNNLNIYTIIHDYNVTINDIKDLNIKGVILSGGPSSCIDKNSPHLKNDVYEYFLKKKIPLFGICYGMQEIAFKMKSEIKKSIKGEFGSVNIKIISDEDENNEKYKNYRIKKNSILFENINKNITSVWMNHNDEVINLPEGCYLINTSDNCFITAFCNEEDTIFAVQYHPEVYETIEGEKIFKNFIYKICKCEKLFNVIKYHEQEFKKIENTMNDHYIVAAMSGGIDSTVAAAYTYKLFKDRFYGIFIDNGLLRKNEGEKVYNFLKKIFPEMHLIKVDASQQFLKELKGITDPEEKRKIIGKVFIEQFENTVHQLNIDIQKTYLLQGTLYPDIIESSVNNDISHTIKTHHNVGGLPTNLKFKLLEPFKFLFKDDVKKLASEINLPEQIINRHPFPGPGLSVRIVGDVTKEKLDILREIDDIFINDLIKYNLYNKVSQAFAVLLSTSKTVGVRGEARCYEYACVLRAVQTSSFMTANWYQIPYDILNNISTHILSSVKCVNRVLYDISSKPPATIEFE